MEKEYLTLREIQLAELEMLKVFDAFCREHGLRYTISGGTLLGAIRHGGFIPWDDDIDLWIPRPEYERFLELIYDQGLKLADNIEIHSGDREDDFAMPFTKIFRTDILVDEEIRTYKSDGDGIWLDLFPVDGLPDTKEEMDREWAEITKLKKQLARSISLITKKRPNESVLKWLARAPIAAFAKIKGFRWYRDRIIETAKSHSYEDSTNLGNIVFGDDRAERELLEKHELEKYMDIPFEDGVFMGFENYDLWLTRRYGDWHTVPSKENQSAHYVKAYRREKL